MSTLNEISENGYLTYQQRKIMHFMLLVTQEIIDTDYIYYVEDDDSATLLLYYGKRVNIKVPDTIDGHKVKRIECTCFNHNTNIRSVVIPDGVESIG